MAQTKTTQSKINDGLFKEPQVKDKDFDGDWWFSGEGNVEPEEESAQELMAKRMALKNVVVEPTIEKPVVKQTINYFVDHNNKTINIGSEYNSDLVNKLKKEARQRSNSSGDSTYKLRLDTIFSFPWHEQTKEETDINVIREKISKSHTGMNKAKNAIIASLIGRLNDPTKSAQGILLVGPPGVGKTTFVDSIYKALNRNYARVNLNQVYEMHDLVGSSNRYANSNSGYILNAMIEAKSKNPVILLDEIDKIGRPKEKDPIPGLLQVLDRAQNHNWKDAFTEAIYDLSKVLWIATANYISNIPREILSRFEVIEMPSYSMSEKITIAKNNICEEMLSYFDKGTRSNLKDATIAHIIKNFTDEGGVRDLKRIMEKLNNLLLLDGKSLRVTKTEQLDISLVNKLLDFKPKKVIYPHIFGNVKTAISTSNGPSIVEIEVSAIKTQSFGPKYSSICEIGPSANAQIDLLSRIAYTAAKKFVIDNNFMTVEEFETYHFTINGIVPDANLMNIDGLAFPIYCAIISSLKIVSFENEILIGKIGINGTFKDWDEASSIIKSLYMVEDVIYTSSLYIDEEVIEEDLSIVTVNYLEDILAHKIEQKSRYLS